MPKDKIVSIRLSLEEYSQWLAYAQMTRQSLSSLIIKATELYISEHHLPDELMTAYENYINLLSKDEEKQNDDSEN